MDKINAGSTRANRTVKDSVFRDLFSRKEYLLMLYQALHPEDTESGIDDLEYLTLEQVLARGIYNDLGFLAGGRLLILVEAQSTWSANILVRCLMYIARTYQGYFRDTGQSVFSPVPVHMPKPELYVVYTGSHEIRDREDTISLSDAFFGGEPAALDVRAKIITGGQDGDIISQYVTFTKVVDRQVRAHGCTTQAIQEAIRICRDRDVLQGYLDEHEKEVIDIMITLYNQEEVWEDYLRSYKKHITDKVTESVTQSVTEKAETKAKIQAAETAQKNALNLHKNGVPVDIIAKSLGYTIQEVEGWLGIAPQA